MEQTKIPPKSSLNTTQSAPRTPHMPTVHIPNLFPTPTKPSKPNYNPKPKPLSRLESALKDIDRQALINQLHTIKLNNTNNPHNLVTHEGITQPLSKWAKQLGIPYNTLKSRYNRGWRGDQLLSTTTYMKYKNE